MLRGNPREPLDAGMKAILATGGALLIGVTLAIRVFLNLKRLMQDLVIFIELVA